MRLLDALNVIVDDGIEAARMDYAKPGDTLKRRNVGGSPTPGTHDAETALAGWGARIRTWEWRNQNPLHLVEADFVASAIVGCAVEASARNFC